MSRSPDMKWRIAGIAIVAAVVATAAFAADRFPGIGRPATHEEIAAWDIDVRPDFLGLPKGSGNALRGQDIWEAKCASCHGIFGESNQVFTPLIGGTTSEDIARGTVANLKRPDYPQRTTMMKAPTVSTLFDYIRRAMPWNEPKSLDDNDVYAVLAFMLNLAEIVPEDFVLDDLSIREVQKRMPNRDGMTRDHALWFGGTTKPDTRNTACMIDCRADISVTSSLPAYAQTAHGNLASQHRRIGPVRGKVTGTDDPDAISDPGSRQLKLAEASGCLACHGIANKIIGPGFADIALRYKGDDVTAKLAEKVRKGTEGVWGAVAMPPQVDLADADAYTLVEWILAGTP
jgi:cytochrome c551/c552